MGQSNLQQLREVGSSQSGDGIPASSGIPAGIRHDGAAVGRTTEAVATVTAGAAAVDNIVKAVFGLAVQPGVQEAKNRLVVAQTSIVQETDDGAESRRRARGTADGSQSTLVVDSKVLALESDVRESTPLLVVQALELVADGLEVAVDGLVLPLGTGPVVGETARREEDGTLGVGLGGGANGRDPGTGSRELRREMGRVLAVVGLARGANARIAGREQDRHATAAELCIQVADGARILLGNGLDWN